MNFRTLSTLSLLGAVIVSMGCSQGGSNLDSTETNLNTQLDSVSYAIGYRNAEFLAGQGITDISKENYLAGFNAALSEQENAFTDQEIQTMVSSYLQKIQEEQGAENEEKGQAFLEENKTKEGIQVTESGLQYKVLEEGTGDSPEAADRVRVHYAGKLVDGTYFDTSIKEVAQEHGLYNAQREPYEPAEFPLNRVIPGWTEGVQLMKEGATYMFYIPGELAYGSRPPQGSPIGPNETLIFRVELLEVLDGGNAQN